MENEQLKKIDDILKRTYTDYSTAKKALEDADGDVLEAIILIENMNKSSYTSSNTKQMGDQILDQIKKVLSKGNSTKLTIKKNNETILNIPITAGIVGAFIAPFLTAAGVTTALLTQCSVEITQSDGNVIDIGQKVDESMNNFKSTMKDVKNSVNQGTQNLKDTVNQGTQDLKDSFNQSTQDVKDAFNQTSNQKSNQTSQSSKDTFSKQTDSDINNLYQL